VSAKRGDRAAPPPRPGGYVLRFASNDATKGWECGRCQEARAPPLRWTTKSTRNLASELTARGHKISHSAVGNLLRSQG
jgi:hypothetical protein